MRTPAHQIAAALEELGLPPDADARDVRRAYASRLKQIDQATQLQAFQALREAYELLARRPAQDEVAQPALEAHAPSPTASARPPLRSGLDATDATFSELAALAVHGLKSRRDAEQALQTALASVALLNLEALTQFESRVADLLLAGWRPGHEYLFEAACECFHWSTDRRHLLRLGHAGQVLDAAIDEGLLCNRELSGEAEEERELVRRLRDPDRPSAITLQIEIHRLRRLVQHYPHWLRVVTSQDNIQQWFEWHGEAQAQARQEQLQRSQEAAARRPANRAAPNRSLPRWVIPLMLFLTMLVGAYLGEQQMEEKRQQSTVTSTVPALQRPVLLPPPPPRRYEESLIPRAPGASGSS